MELIAGGEAAVGARAEQPRHGADGRAAAAPARRPSPATAATLGIYHEAPQLEPLPGLRSRAGSSAASRSPPVAAPAIAFATVTLELPGAAPLDGFLVSRSA